MLKKQLYRETLNLILSVIFMIAAWLLSYFIHDDGWYVLLSYGLAFIIGGYYKAKEGIKLTIKNKSLNVEILMILAALGAFISDDYAEGTILIFIFALSGVLESFAMSKSEKALTSLLNLAPRTALLIKDDEEITVPVNKLSIGDVVKVKVGQQIPVDGEIIKGSTSLDQSAITGEFIPVYRSEGDQVYAGSLNIESSIRVLTQVDSNHTVVQQIINLVKTAQENKTEKQTLINKIEKYYVYIVIILSIFMMIFGSLLGLSQAEAIRRGIIVLVVGSPCALVASITPAMLASLSNAAHKRILIKGGKTLESLIDIDTIVFDKTGTITSGIPKVVKTEIIDLYDDKEVIDILYTLAKQSNHPLAQAIVKYYQAKATDKKYKTAEISGHGMEAKIGDDIWRIGKFEAMQHSAIQESYITCTSLGHSTVNIIKNNEIIGFVALIDSIREHVIPVIDDLHQHQIKTYMITGDNAFTGAYIAKESHVDNYFADCLPEDKVKHISNFQEDNHKVIMVGDGINDAPALAQSDIGIAMGAGTDITLETADIIFMDDKLEDLPKIIKLAKRMRSITLQNIIFSISVIIFLMCINLIGKLDIELGVVFHEGSTILVILNSLRLLRK